MDETNFFIGSGRVDSSQATKVDDCFIIQSKPHKYLAIIGTDHLRGFVAYDVVVLYHFLLLVTHIIHLGDTDVAVNE